ncbi:CHAD domain-containing protein [Verticiella sediminum]|uniref:CHAD domain-containing protein n=2 Tax=Verticiella sediminum TaxID=1247510 RepID=A0A556B218_9BURK|nr:CHAD domain-containing protein [Verticiella sediminum]TSH99237.1 CHAD domain-containing protein [Verticiella sediminum]
MVEQEIKLYVPPAAREAVKARLTKLPGPRRVRLRAMYFDTPSRWLARHLAAIRLRLEGRQWVQTFKMAGADSVSRIELNHRRPGPELDLSVYAGTPAEPLFAALDGELALRYETDVMRLVRQVRVRRANIEIAYDVGAVRAPGFEAQINEIEFERTAGWVDALFGVAIDWVKEHGLVLDARSKAERGDALARAGTVLAQALPEDEARVRAAQRAQLDAPVGAAKLDLPADATPALALQMLSQSAFDQIVRNAALIAMAPAGADMAEHVHQLRVGVRRLRSGWRLLRGWTTLPEPALQEDARRFFQAFGAARDTDVLLDTVFPTLEQAGMPPLARPVRAEGDAAGMAASHAFQTWLIELLRWLASLPARSAVSQAVAGNDGAEPYAPLAVARLRKWHRAVLRDGARYRELDEHARHALRKDVKRLRYGLGFARAYFESARLKPYLKRLSTLQDVLGEVNDLAVARGYFLQRAHAEPAAWFAVGWIAARLSALESETVREVEALGKTRKFW